MYFLLIGLVAAGHEVPGNRPGGRLELVGGAVAVCPGCRLVGLGRCSGYTKRKEMEKMEQRKQKRIDKQTRGHGHAPQETALKALPGTRKRLP